MAFNYSVKALSCLLCRFFCFSSCFPFNKRATVAAGDVFVCGGVEGRYGNSHPVVASF